MLFLYLLLTQEVSVHTGDVVRFSRGDTVCVRLVVGVDREPDGTETVHLVDGSYAASDLPSDWEVIGAAQQTAIESGPPEVMP